MTPLLSTDVTHNSLIGDIASWFLQQTSAGLSLFNMAMQVEILSEVPNIAPTYLQLPLRHWGAGNVYLLVLSS